MGADVVAPAHEPGGGSGAAAAPNATADGRIGSALGEVRGPEALELVRAMNTGHDGTLCTLHSNGTAETLRRLHTLVAEAQPSSPLAGIHAAVDHVVQLEGRGDRRRLASIWQVVR